MALLTISGDPASRWQDVAHAAAQLLRFELVTESRLADWIVQEFGDVAIPERAWRAAAVSVLSRMATEHHMVLAFIGSEALFRPLPMLLRAEIVAPEARRVGNVMLDQRLEKPDAKKFLADAGAEIRRTRKARLGRSSAPPDTFDVILNAENLDANQMGEILRSAASARGLEEQGMLSSGAAAEFQFQTSFQLARHGIVPAGRAHLKRVSFSHPSEELFANLLDFYRIQWEYEPRSFPLQWDKDGNVIEAFTPDFYLPELDQYVELTTMKQTLVTKKNRKIKLLRAIYPHINIQIFYQKDFQDLVFKYGLASGSIMSPAEKGAQ